MAIVVEMLVPVASKDQADQFDASIERAMLQMGGPPAGLMVHFARPSGEGFQLFNVWRSEVDMKAFYDEVIRPRLADAGLTPEEPLVAPVWVFARP